MSLEDSQARCHGASSDGDGWVYECEDCERRTASVVLDGEMIRPPLFLAVCWFRIPLLSGKS
jgi:hypothetical protein